MVRIIWWLRYILYIFITIWAGALCISLFLIHNNIVIWWPCKQYIIIQRRRRRVYKSTYVTYIQQYIIMTRVYAVLAKTLSPKNRRVDASDSLDVWKYYYYYIVYGRVHLLYNNIIQAQFSFFFRKTWPTCHRGSLNVGEWARVCGCAYYVCVCCSSS